MRGLQTGTRRLLVTGLLVATVCDARAMGIEDDPLLFTVFAEQLEWRAQGGDSGFAWDVDAWLGYDVNKAWLKTEGETEDGSTEKAEAQLLYSRAIAPFWDLQAGWRREFQPGPDRDWLALGVQGLAPYHFHVDASVFIGTSGRTAARLEAEYDLRLTQRWILAPNLELDAHGEDDRERGIGSGLSSGELGFRLRYEIRRRIAPYAGIHWERKFGNTADFAREDGESTSGWRWVLGVRAWF